MECARPIFMARKRSAPDPDKIFAHASKFFWTDKYLRSKSTTAEMVPMVAHPAMVLSAFASELYLKCLLAIEESKVPDTHDLHDLFCRLNTKTQQRVEALWDEHIQHPDRAKVLDYIENVLKQGSVPRKLSWALEVGNRAFEELRYIYEVDKPSIKFVLGDLPELLRRVAIEKRPQLATLGPGLAPVGVR
jgi:hypothetical protein